MKNNSMNQPVTKREFLKETHSIHKKIDSSVARLDKKIDNVALALIKTQKDVAEIKETMSTKDDINLVINKIDHFSKKIDVYSKKAIVHDYRLNQIEEKLGMHPRQRR